MLQIKKILLSISQLSKDDLAFLKFLSKCQTTNSGREGIATKSRRGDLYSLDLPNSATFRARPSGKASEEI